MSKMPTIPDLQWKEQESMTRLTTWVFLEYRRALEYVPSRELSAWCVPQAPCQCRQFEPATQHANTPVRLQSLTLRTLKLCLKHINKELKWTSLHFTSSLLSKEKALQTTQFVHINKTPMYFQSNLLWTHEETRRTDQTKASTSSDHKVHCRL